MIANSAENISSSALEGTQGDVLMLALFVLVALGFSFLCSVAEAVLLSITPSYIEGLREKRPKRAALLKKLKQDNVDRALAAILTLNTIAHTVGAIGAGAKATVVFGSAWFGVFSAVMTFMILFFSEIVPKTIGAVYWTRLTTLTAYFVQMLIVVLYPIVWISEKLTWLIARNKEVSAFSRDELVAMVRVGEHSGHIQRKESRIIRNLMRFDSLRVIDIMTPRTVMSALSEETSIAEAFEQVSKLPFSRLPIYGENIDNVTGFVLKDEILLHNSQGRGKEKLKSLSREIHAVPESVSLSTLLGDLLKDHQHISIVLDEHGGVEGLVTLEDLFETLIGMEIMDETDNVEDMRSLARKQWVKRAKALGMNEVY